MDRAAGPQSPGSDAGGSTAMPAYADPRDAAAQLESSATAARGAILRIVNVPIPVMQMQFPCH